MRRALACLLILAAVSSSALAQTPKPTRVIPTPSTAAPVQQAPPALPPPLIPLTGATQARDPDQCRAACSRTYFFCKANSDDDSCPSSWMQCKSRCTATYTPRPLGGQN